MTVNLNTDVIRTYAKRCRLNKGMNINLLAKNIGVSRPLVSNFETGKSNMDDMKIDKIFKVLSSNEYEYEEHSNFIFKEIGLRLSDIQSNETEYGITEYDFSLIDKLAKVFTYKDKPLKDSDIALIKQLAKTLADKN